MEKVKDGKILWVDEAYFVVPSNPVLDLAGVGGNGIKALKLFLSGKEGSPIKDKFFTPSTEYLTSDETNTHITAGLKAIERSFRDELRNKLTSLADDIQTTELLLTDKEQLATKLALMEGTANEVFRTYELAMSIDPSLKTTAYQEAKPYLQKIANKELPVNDIIKNEVTYKSFEENCRKSILALANDIEITYKNALNETSIVSKDRLFKDPLLMLVQQNDLDETPVVSAKKNAIDETKNKIATDESTPDEASQEYTLLEIYNELRNTKTIDAGTLLGDNGLLTIALGVVSSEMEKANPDVITCSKIMELAQVMVSKLTEAKANVKLVSAKVALLSNKIQSPEKAIVEDGSAAVDVATSLDAILKKGKLNKVVFEQLFGKDGSIAASLMQRYRDNPRDVLNQMRALIVEKIRRRFEAKSNGNASDFSKSFYAAIRSNDFLQDPKTRTVWEKFVNKIEYQDLESTKPEVRKELKKYEKILESISDFEFIGK